MKESLEKKIPENQPTMFWTPQRGVVARSEVKAEAIWNFVPGDQLNLVIRYFFKDNLKECFRHQHIMSFQTLTETTLSSIMEDRLNIWTPNYGLLPFAFIKREVHWVLHLMDHASCTVVYKIRQDDTEISKSSHILALKSLSSTSKAGAQ